MKYPCGPLESQLRGRLRPGCGQAGHSIASSPKVVAAAPLGSCPWPEHVRATAEIDR